MFGFNKRASKNQMSLAVVTHHKQRKAVNRRITFLPQKKKGNFYPSSLKSNPGVNLIFILNVQLVIASLGANK